MKNFGSIKAFTLIEVLIASVVSFITLGMISYGVTRMSKDTTSAGTDFTVETDLYQLVEQILKTGHGADYCIKKKVTSATATVTDPVSVSIQCDIKIYSDQPATSYRFRKIQTENQVRYETLGSLGWSTTRTFGNETNYPISEFNICDFSETIAGLPTCPIGNANFGNILNLSGFKSRYFRFQIKAVQKDRNNNDKRSYDLPSAFFVRNPPPLAGITLLWGAK